jgi:hypothetical protein
MSPGGGTEVISPEDFWLRRPYPRVFCHIGSAALPKRCISVVRTFLWLNVVALPPLEDSGRGSHRSALTPRPSIGFYWSIEKRGMRHASPSSVEESLALLGGGCA